MMPDNGSVLVVEDELIIALDIKMSLIDWGWNVVGPASRIEQAIKLVDSENIDLAILDYNLTGGTTKELALKLVVMGIPVIFLSGDAINDRPDKLRDFPLLAKPMDMSKLNSEITRLLAK